MGNEVVEKVEAKLEAKKEPRFIRLTLAERVAAVAMLMRVKAKGQVGRQVNRAIRAVELEDDEADRLGELANEEQMLRQIPISATTDEKRSQSAQHKRAVAVLRNYRRSWSYLRVTRENLDVMLKFLVNDEDTEMEGADYYNLHELPEQVAATAGCQDPEDWRIKGPSIAQEVDARQSNPFLRLEVEDAGA